MRKYSFVAMGLCVVLGLSMILVGGCGKTKEDVADETTSNTTVENTVEVTIPIEVEEEKVPQILNEGGIEVTIPLGYFARAKELYHGENEIIIFAVDEETVEAAEEERILPRIEIKTYPQNETPHHMGERDVELVFDQVKEVFTEYCGRISGTTPVEEVSVAGTPFVMTTTMRDAVKANLMSGVSEGYAVDINVIGPDFKDTQEANDVLDSIKFNVAEFYQSKPSE